MTQIEIDENFLNYNPGSPGAVERGCTCPAWIELFSLSTGKQIELINKAYREDLPPWAKLFAD